MKLSTCAACFAAFVLMGCVTINIYFPASAAEKAADKIIDAIRKKTREPSVSSFQQDTDIDDLDVFFNDKLIKTVNYEVMAAK